jgi:response regulator RpfG family c-di-GMP phosphodiesterase
LLLVDEEISVLASLRQLLHQEEYHILTASSAADGFKLLALNDGSQHRCAGDQQARRKRMRLQY